MLPFGLHFEAPWALLGLLLLPFLPRGPGWPLRLLALAFLVVALAQPTGARPGQQAAILIDVSESVGEAAIQAAEGLELSGLQAPPLLFYFAEDATRVERLEPPPDFLPRGQTDLSRALQVAAASGAGRTLLISDGAESVGAALSALPEGSIDTLLTASRPNVRLAALLAPEGAQPGETVEVIAVLESDQATTVTLYPEVGDTGLAPITRRLEPGRTPIPFRFEAGTEATLNVAATLEADFEQAKGDDRQATDIAVSEAEPVLIINDPALAALLGAQGIEAVSGTPGDLVSPLRYSLVVLRDGANAFTTGQLELLRSYVENGGGLLMTGGPDSFGFGGWYRTPVEEVLPVNTDLRTEVELPLVALVIVLDRSQSMNTGNPTKLELAKEGAIGVVDLAYQDDLLGLIVFSDADAAEWSFQLRRATDQGKREMLGAILNVQAQGGTVLEPAYTQAIAALQATEASIKHIIVLSDGKLYDGGVLGAPTNEVNFNAMAASAQLVGITTSAIAIGEGADFERLESIARSGGGRYYEALEVATLPRIFTSEALTATRSLLREETFSPEPAANPLLPSGLGTPPTLNAYIATTLKPESEVLLAGLQGEPVLAVSRQGLGRSAVLTTDLNGWAGDFGGWDALPGLLGTVTRWLQTRPADFAATVRREGTQLSVVVDAVRDGQYVNDRVLEVRYGGETRALEQVAPGRYEGSLPFSAAGGSLLVIDEGEVVAREDVQVEAPEFDTDGGAALLQTIALRSGGVFYETLDAYAPELPDERAPLWPYPAVAGLIVFLLELTLRRFAPVRQPTLARSGG